MEGTTDAASAACRAVVAEAVVLDSLPMLGGDKGLELVDSGSNSQRRNRINFRIAKRGYEVATAPPLELLGSEGLLAFRAPLGYYRGTPSTLPLGTFLPDEAAKDVDLDALCKPHRHWSGQRHTAMPDELPGNHPVRTESAVALGQRIARLINEEPPDIAAIEQSFGTRMMALGDPSPGRTKVVTLVRLPENWLRMHWEASVVRSGALPHTRLEIYATGPYPNVRKSPWWDSDASDATAHADVCLTLAMITRHIGDGWGLFPVSSAAYIARLTRSFSQYSVEIRFDPPYADGRKRDGHSSLNECIRSMHVDYRPRQES